MRRLLLDTGVAADYMFRRGDVYARARGEVAAGTRLGVCLPVLGELFAGVENSDTRDRNRQRLVNQLRDFAIWPFDRQSAEEYGRLFAMLRRAGRPMPQIDIQIAAIALRLPHCTLATRDSDFAAIPGLRLEQW